MPPSYFNFLVSLSLSLSPSNNSMLVLAKGLFLPVVSHNFILLSRLDKPSYFLTNGSLALLHTLSPSLAVRGTRKEQLQVYFFSRVVLATLTGTSKVTNKQTQGERGKVRDKIESARCFVLTWCTDLLVVTKEKSIDCPRYQLHFVANLNVTAEQVLLCTERQLREKREKEREREN